jgi:sulfite exporter TauE/SafE
MLDSLSIINENLKMSLMPELANLHLEAFAVGVLYGLAFCTSACLPYIASYIAGIGADLRKGVLITLIYNSGRLTAYALVGGVIGMLSGAFRFSVDEAAIVSFQEYSSYAFSIVTIAIGVNILQRSRSLSRKCTLQNGEQPYAANEGKRFDVRAFSLGLSRGLVVCPPLLMLLLSSVVLAAPVDTFAVAILFGLGTALSPLLLLGGITGWLLSKAPLFRKWIAMGGAIILIVLGVGTLITAVIATCT